jgi:thiol-disulfide isomerase/thioredoxin
VFDFYADWCGPCHDVDRHMHALLAQDKGLAYRRINIVSWDSEVAKHHLAGAKGLPFVIVFDKHGRELERISGVDLDALDRAIREAQTR